MALQAAAGQPVARAPADIRHGLVMLRHTEDIFLDEDEMHVVFHR